MSAAAAINPTRKSRAKYLMPTRSKAALAFQEMVDHYHPIAIGDQCDQRLVAAAKTFQTRIAALDLERYVRARQPRAHASLATLLTEVVRPTLLRIAKIVGRDIDALLSRIFDGDKAGGAFSNPDLNDRHRRSLQRACGPLAKTAIETVWQVAILIARDSPSQSVISAQTDKRIFRECIEPVFSAVVKSRLSDIVHRNLELEAVYSKRRSLDTFVDDIVGMRIGEWLNNRKPPFKKTPSALLANLTRLAKTFSGNIYSYQAPAAASINHEVDLVFEIIHRILDRRSESGIRKRAEVRRHEYAKAPWEGGSHCALCSGLTELTVMRMRPHNSVSGSAHSNRAPSKDYCALHAPRSARRRGGNDPIRKRFAEIRERIYDERADDSRYLARFIHPDEGPAFPWEWQLLWRAMAVRMQYANTPRLFVFESNVLEVVSLIAEDGPDDDALEIDRLVQSGMNQPQIARKLRKTAKYIGARNHVAIAHLRHQGLTWPQIAQRLGVSRRAIYKRKESIWGCFDFSPGRSKELVWWPYDDLPVDPDIVRFGKCAVRKWHTVEEYTNQMPRRHRAKNGEDDAREFSYDGAHFGVNRLQIADDTVLVHISRKLSLEAFIRVVVRNAAASRTNQMYTNTETRRETTLG